MFQKRKKFLITLFFAFIGAYFIFIQWSATFPDPDSFYHIKMAVLMQKNLIIKTFPWIQFADFTNNFTDHHFLYHIFLVPFVFLFPPLLGGKIATVIFALIAVGVFYIFLKKWQIKSPLFYTLILLSSAPFIFRINLAKTSALSLVILLMSLNLLWRKKYLALTAASFLYVWFYGGWSLLLILLFSQIMSELIINKQFNWRATLSIVGGLIGGLILNPYFPENLLFYWQQMIQIGLINYQDTIQVGMEWYPYDPLELLANNIFIFLLIILALAFLVYTVRKNQMVNTKKINEEFIKIFSLFIFAGILFLLTLKSQRFVEYFAPFAILAPAFFLNILLPENFSFAKEIARSLKKENKVNMILITYLITVFVLFFVLNTIRIRDQMTARYHWDYLKNASLWLQNNTLAGSLVFNINWGDWPMLFFHNDQNVYINGLDPTFFYLKDKNLYQEWIKIGRGEIKENLAEKIKKGFGAEWVLVKNSETELLSVIRNDNSFEMRFNDQEAKIYFLR